MNEALIVSFQLPYPPTVNHYYLHTSNGVIIGVKGKKYRSDVSKLLHKYRGVCTESMRLSLVIGMYPPDKRKRDVDNILKCTMDSIQHAKVYHDDNQIDKLMVTRMPMVENGMLEISLFEVLIGS